MAAGGWRSRSDVRRAPPLPPFWLLILMLLLAATAVGETGHDALPSAAEALARLRAGNARFVADPAAALPVDASRRAALVEHQSPWAAVLTCSDSRVPPELIFQAGLGELFVVRTAGHVADRVVLGTIEYAVHHLGVPLVVVMGHESCGAVAAARQGGRDDPPASVRLPNLERLLGSITPAFDRLPTPADRLQVRDAVLANVEQTVNDLIAGSTVVRDALSRGAVHLIGAYYELATGIVRFSQPVTSVPAAAGSATSSVHP